MGEIRKLSFRILAPSIKIATYVEYDIQTSNYPTLRFRNGRILFIISHVGDRETQLLVILTDSIGLLKVITAT